MGIKEVHMMRFEIDVDGGLWAEALSRAFEQAASIMRETNWTHCPRIELTHRSPERTNQTLQRITITGDVKRRRSPTKINQTTNNS